MTKPKIHGRTRVPLIDPTCLRPANQREQRPIDSPEYQAILDEIESSQPFTEKMLVRCPHCGWISEVRSSKQLTSLVRIYFCQCKNLACGHTFKAHLEVVQTISPSAVADPVIAQQLENTKKLLAARQPKNAGQEAAASG